MPNKDSLKFADLMPDVKPLKTATKVLPEKKTPQAKARFTQAEKQALLDESLAPPNFNEIETGDTLSWHQSGIQKNVLRKLRRGFYSVKGELDLHGMNQSDAKRAVYQFLDEASTQRYNCLRIVHGKGNRSAYGPVLKRAIGGWLVKRKDVLAFASTPSHDGGTGAIYVLLKTPR